ncbi:hypothetical protein AZA_83790 [Nitrospirillum viridazoti Y2]|nr:hypothetical protein AZA_83790 [Nitrospirillum amazonense Y2]
MGGHGFVLAARIGQGIPQINEQLGIVRLGRHGGAVSLNGLDQLALAVQGHAQIGQRRHEVRPHGQGPPEGVHRRLGIAQLQQRHAQVGPGGGVIRRRRHDRVIVGRRLGPLAVQHQFLAVVSHVRPTSLKPPHGTAS